MSFHPTLQNHLQLRDGLQGHRLFAITDNLQQITSPSDVGYHPDSVLSVFENFTVNQMPASGVRGDDFVAIRYAPVDQYDQTHAQVACVYLRNINDKWTMRMENQPVSVHEFDKFAKLAKGEPVKLSDDRVWQRI